MTQENKELLLKDLCDRIMYGVKCTVYEDTNVHTLSGILPNKVYNELYFEELDWKECDGFADIQYCKPYLFPMSSITEEQWREITDIQIQESLKSLDSIDDSISNPLFSTDDLKTIEWCYANHIDIHDLIPMGLALDATGLNVY